MLSSRHEIRITGLSKDAQVYSCFVLIPGLLGYRSGDSELESVELFPMFPHRFDGLSLHHFSLLFDI